MIAVLLVVLALLVACGGVGFGLQRRSRAQGARTPSISRGSIDPFTINEPWRRFVQDALQARSRFDDVVAGAKPGPLRDRLKEIGRSLEAGVRSTWDTAREGQLLRDARRKIDVAQVQRRLQQVRDAADATAEAMTRSLEAQLQVAARLDAVSAEAESKLRLMVVQLDESVAHAAGMSVRAGDVSDLVGIETEIAQVAEQMHALRLALEETNQLGRTGTTGG